MFNPMPIPMPKKFQKILNIFNLFRTLKNLKIREHSGTFGKFLELSGTVVNILEHFKNLGNIVVF